MQRRHLFVERAASRVALRLRLRELRRLIFQLSSAKREGLFALRGILLLAFERRLRLRKLLFGGEEFFASLFQLLMLIAQLRQPLLMLRREFRLLALPLLFALGEFAAQLLKLRRFIIELRGAAREIVIAAGGLRAVLRQLRGQQLHLVGECRFDAANAFAFRMQQLTGAFSMSFEGARKLVAPHIGADDFSRLFFQGVHKPNLSSEDPTQRSSGVSA